MKFIQARKLKILYIVPALIVMLIMLIVFLLKGFYPFGDVAVLQIDADYNYVPTLFKTYDIFYNGDSLLWDFKLGSGGNIYGSLVTNSIYSPINWLVIFSSRNNIVNFFNILLIIKYMLMATTMFIFIRKNFEKVNLYWQIVLSLMYVFSGWGFLMYSNIFYIDTIILFPLIIHYLIKLFKDGKILGFIITLSYSLILNFYLSYMIYLFVIFSSLIALILFIKKEDRAKIIVNLSFSLVLPVVISCFSHLPTIIQILTSVRSSTVEYDGFFYYFFLKVVNLTMSSLIVCLFIKFIKLYQKNKDKEVLFYIILFLLTTIGVIIEPINRIWHTGNYNSFPYRHSFIPIFIMICGSLKYLSNQENKVIQTEKKDKKIFLIVSLCLISIFIFLFNFNDIIKAEMIGFDITKPGIFITMIILFVFFFICHYYSFKTEKLEKQKILSVILVLIEIFIYSNWCFNDYKYQKCYQALEYEKNVNIDDDELYKYVDYQAGLGVNSSYITRNATLANWLHIIPNKQFDFARKFGYSNQGYLIYGFGGTIFSDVLIGTKYIYSEIELPESLFDLKSSFNYKEKNVFFYQVKNDTSFGFTYNKNINDYEENGFFEAQNYYYQKLFNIDDNIVNIKKFSSDKSDKKLYKYKLKNSEPIVLYLEVTEDLLKSGIDEILLNDEKITIGNSEKIVYLDEYGGNIDIQINMNEKVDTNFQEIKFGYISIDDYQELTEKIQVEYNEFEFNKNKLHINIDSDKEQYLFLPINNIDGWRAKINGENTKLEDVIYTFMSIKLNKGNNDITLEFYPPYLKEGIVVSIVGILLLIFYMIFKNKIINMLFVQKIVVFLYYLISISFFIFVYILSNFIFI